jgi:glutamine amidotransferase-like uncharacterized protein
MTFDRTALVHCGVGVGDVVEIGCHVEHLSRVDPTVEQIRRAGVNLSRRKRRG